MKGWQCPVCSRVWSPATAGCDNCNGGSRDLKQRAVVSLAAAKRKALGC